MNNGGVRVNSNIRYPRIRIILADGSNGGIMETSLALKLAEEQCLDLMEISPQAVPPVCKLLDYGKYLYEEKRKDKENKKAQRNAQTELKEIQLSPVIQENDLNIKIKNIQRLLNEGNKVKVMIKFAGRQIRHSELAKILFEKVLDKLSDRVSVEKSPDWEGRSLQMIIVMPQ